MTQIVVTGILDTVVDELPRSKTLMTIGMQAELETHTYLVVNKHLVAFEKARDAAKTNYQSVAERSTELTKALRKLDPDWTPWTETQKAEVGNWLVNCASNLGLFVETKVTERDGKRKVEQRYLELTPEASEIADAIIKRLHERLTYHLPSLTPPVPWTDSRQLISNAHVAMVGSRFWNNDKVIKAEIDTGMITRPLAALNAAQAVAWKVNTFIVDVAEQCFKRDIKVKGIPPKDLEGDDEKIDTLNRKYRSQRLELTMDIRTARQFAGVAFWTPMRLDYRETVRISV